MLLNRCKIITCILIIPLHKEEGANKVPLVTKRGPKGKTCFESTLLHYYTQTVQNGTNLFNRFLFLCVAGAKRPNMTLN